MILKCCRLVDPGVPTLQDQSCPSASCSVKRNWWLILAAKSKKHSVPSQTCTGPKCQCKTLSYSCFRSLMLRFANGGFIRLGSKIERVENRVIILVECKLLDPRSYTWSKSKVWKKWSGTDVASLTCPMSLIPTRENTPPRLRNQFSRLGPILSMKVRSIESVLNSKFLGAGP